MTKSTVLITGCSDGGLGSALALAFHDAGYRVIATARNTTKLSDMKKAGIETLSLDILSEQSLIGAKEQVERLTEGSLDILVNNAGAVYFTPLTDASIDKGKELFDLNVWAGLKTIQTFLPLLLKSSKGGIIINHTSVSSVMAPPFTALYAASKAALASINNSLRLELAPFGIKVVDLKSGSVKSNIFTNSSAPVTTLPRNSLYYCAHEWLDKFLSGQVFAEDAIDANIWAKQVVDAISKRNSLRQIWCGGSSWVIWFASCLPINITDFVLKRLVRLDLIEKQLREYGMDKAIDAAYNLKQE